jgi:hypothetical protein
MGLGRPDKSASVRNNPDSRRAAPGDRCPPAAGTPDILPATTRENTPSRRRQFSRLRALFPHPTPHFEFRDSEHKTPHRFTAAPQFARNPLLGTRQWPAGADYRVGA